MDRPNRLRRPREAEAACAGEAFGRDGGLPIRTLVPLLLLLLLLVLSLAVLVPAGAAVEPVCATTPKVADQRAMVCLAPGSDVCPVYVHRWTGWLSYGTCFPPQADGPAPAGDRQPLLP